FVRKYFRITTPVVANECLWSMGIVLYSVVYGHMGTATVAAVSIYNTVEQIGFAFIRGVVHTCAVLVGKRIGAGDEQDANLTARRMMVAAVGIALFAGALLAASSGWIVQIFNVSENVRSAARALICINAAFMPLNALNTVIIVGVMRAGGDVTCSLLLDAGTIWVIGVPLVALAGLGLGWSITAVFLLAQVENAVKLTLGLLRLRSGKWVHNLVHTA
ncbi:MAG: MATE family efflux transporter, partial [Clostridia bacterium]